MEGGSSDVMGKYPAVRDSIERRLGDFRSIWENGDAGTLFRELVFCILTPQSRARTCWEAVLRLQAAGILFSGDEMSIRALIYDIRFPNNKARNIREAQNRFGGGRENPRSAISRISGPKEKRMWLVREIRGIGMKEASHYLRNIGLGEELAILDRHILRGMLELGALEEMPLSISEKRYEELEDRFMLLSDRVGIPPSHLDLLLWYDRTGEIFK